MVPHFSFNFLISPSAVFIIIHFLQCCPWHGMSYFWSGGLTWEFHHAKLCSVTVCGSVAFGAGVTGVDLVTESDNDDDDFVHPKLSTFDEKERQDEEDKEEEWSDDEAYDAETQGVNVEGEELDKEEINKEEEANELYRDVYVNFEERDTEMIDALLANVQTTQVIEDTHVIITAATPEVQQSVSSIPGIVDTYLANKMNEAVKKAVQLHSDRLRDEAQAENADFINKLNDNIKKIIKEQVKTSHAIAANLFELELKKILIDKIKSNKSIHRSDQQKTLYKALDEGEEPFVRSNWGSKRRRAGKEPESTSAPKEKTSKSSGKSKEGSKSHNMSTGKSAQAEEPIHADKYLEEPAHQDFDTRFTKNQPVDETTQHHDWFQKPTKPQTPDHDWNKTLPAAHGAIQH
ncbi:hypothetical protein Tco_0430941 [Tanacetum coccineum]